MTIDWGSRIAKSNKFLEKSRVHGRKVYRRFEDERDQASTLIKRPNFFYANVNTLKESLFNSLPKPDVNRVQKGNFQDDASRVAALIVQRGLTYEVECAPHFEESITSAILDRLVPGTGQTWIRFDVSKGEDGEPQPGTETIYVDHVFWEDFIYEPARKWSKVGWVGRIHRLTEEEITKKFGESAMDKVGAGKNHNEDSLTPKEITDDTHCVYELWDKGTKKRYFTGESGTVLEEKDDPYKLAKFFPCPRPLIANVTTNKFLAITDYHIAQDQYDQLDTIYARIQLIISAIKVLGIYDASLMSIQRMFESDENQMIPVDSWAMVAETGGLKNRIEFYPVEQVASVLMALQTQFEAAKAVLYEITGMSDILRGASNPYETKGAQQIKAQFASVRMNGYQRDVAIFVRDTLRIMAELMCQLYSIEKLKLIVGELAEPDMAFAEQAVAILRDDMMAKYKVDIQSNSLTQADWALEKEQRMEVVNNLGQMLQQTMQMYETVPQIAVLAVQMIKFAIAGFKGASEFEGYVDQQLDIMMRKQQEAEANPEPPKPSPEEQKMQMEMQKAQMDAQLKQQENEQKMGMEQQKMAMEQQKQQAELAHQQQMFQLEIEMKTMELQFKREEHQLAMQSKTQEAVLNAQVKEQGASMDLENKAVQHEQNQQFAKDKAKADANKPKPKGAK